MRKKLDPDCLCAPLMHSSTGLGVKVNMTGTRSLYSKITTQPRTVEADRRPSAANPKAGQNLSMLANTLIVVASAVETRCLWQNTIVWLAGSLFKTKKTDISARLLGRIQKKAVVLPEKHRLSGMYLARRLQVTR